ncbi:phage terminase large subunit family protein [Falsiroseomonas selenitidurans]|uniref:Terminase n=1 Tax=Falsiroseomonas selenitidurans TaxID=2716335 RepID=A0ABX1EF09_9PROT|nr:terminase gpA endonuclease subunit [Falsiroseomonas selenitidurans]NKC33490.1 hypothetical protein [Falsiroseomonas selenitidurans]
MEALPPADDSARFLARLFAEGIRPDPRRTVSAWAEAERVVSEGSSQGRWRNERAPYLTEVMDRCSLRDPTRRVTLLGSAQCGKTQVGLNFCGQVLSETPADVLVLLPTEASMRMYNRDKLDRMIQASPALMRAVAEVTDRTGEESTKYFKRGARGAQVEIGNAGSSRDLQSRTVRALLAEEVSEFEEDVGGRGDPLEQGLARTIQWRRRGHKEILISTPGIKGHCRITKSYDEGSRATFHVPCPHCQHEQELVFANLRWPAGKPAAAEYHCAECGQAIAETAKRDMLRRGRWVHERPDMIPLNASYRINTLYSPFTPWADLAAEAEKVEADPSKAKVFAQQWLGEAFDEAFDLPKAEILLARGDTWPVRRIPPGVLFLTGATDVQGDFLAWAVWGFDRHFGQWLIDTGVLQGDPTQDEVWLRHEALLTRTWRDAWGREVAPQAWGVDSGYLSGHVYRHVMLQAGRRAFQVMALDGREGWRLPPLGKEVWRPIRGPGQEHIDPKLLPKCPIYPVGTWDLKSEIASALRLTEIGPGREGWPVGALRWNGQMVDRAWVDELLAERFVEDPRSGIRKWKRLAARNEAFDLAVYTRALARAMALPMTEADWAALIASTQGAPQAAQGDLMALMTPGLVAQAEAARAEMAARDGRNAAEPEAPPPNMTAWGPAPSWGGASAW